MREDCNRTSKRRAVGALVGLATACTLSFSRVRGTAPCSHADWAQVAAKGRETGACGELSCLLPMDLQVGQFDKHLPAFQSLCFHPKPRQVVKRQSA